MRGRHPRGPVTLLRPRLTCYAPCRRVPVLYFSPPGGPVAQVGQAPWHNILDQRCPGPSIRGRSLADRDSLLRRLHELRSEHRDLDTVIARLDEAGADALQLQRLKKRKLKLKDEITWLESRLVPDIIA